MSGKRQHFIPQFYQKGFLSKDKKNYTYQYLKDGRILPANIKNVATEGFFYSEGEDHSIDNVITDAEDEFAKLITIFRSDDIDDVYFNDVPKLISHLESRTRSIRVSFQNSATYLMGEIKEKFLKDDVLTKYFKEKILSDPNKFNELLDAQLDEKKVPLELRDGIKKLMLANSDQWIPPVVKNLVEEIKPLLDVMISTKLPEAMKSGHLKALRESIHPAIKVKKYDLLTFKVINTDFDIPLGDSIVLFEVDGKRSFKPFCERDDLLKNIYLPISSRRILWGTLDDLIPNLNDLDLNIARCSMEFFIASSKNERFNYIQREIGQNSHILAEEEIDQILDELIGESLNC
jgi:hypothetical protein